MRLRADAVVLVFDQRVLEILKGLLGIRRRAGQHEADGMKQPHVRVGEAMSGRKLQRFANIAQQHVGSLHLRQRLVERFGDGFLHQAFFQPNAQFAGDDLENVLGLKRGRALQQRLQHAGLCRRSAGCGDLVEGVTDVLQGDRRGLWRFRQQHIVSCGSQIAALAVCRCHGGFARPGDLRHQLPQCRSADLQGALVEGRERPPRQKHRRDRCVSQLLRAEVFRQHRHLLAFLGGGGKALAEFSQLLHGRNVWMRKPGAMRDGHHLCHPSAREGRDCRPPPDVSCFALPLWG